MNGSLTGLIVKLSARIHCEKMGENFGENLTEIA